MAKIFILTGSGISAESGLDTYRSLDGVWKRHKAEEVATLSGWHKSPEAVWKFTAQMKLAAARSTPNAAHVAVAQACVTLRVMGVPVFLVTQNVDTLHEQALLSCGAPMSLCVAMHGRLGVSRCVSCNSAWNDPFVHFDEQGHPAGNTTVELAFAPELPFLERPMPREADALPLSPCCGALLRPGIVWFGEVPHQLNDCYSAIEGTDIFLSIGTSGTVAPASEFVKWVRRLNPRARAIFVNTTASHAGTLFTDLRIGNATETVPALINEILSQFRAGVTSCES